MKTVSKLKQSELDHRFDVLLRELIGRVPFLKLASLRKDAQVSPDLADRAGRVALVTAGGRKWTLVVEGKRLGQPREVRTGLLQLERYLKHLPEGKSRYGVLLAPFISEQSARLCTEAGIGYADLAGNARLSFDHVFIETRGAENPFREKRETQSLFAPRAARVLRVLLQGPLRPWKVVPLAKSAQVSLGWVSAVRQQLLAHEWATGETGGLLVSKPGAVLDAWAEADDWNRRTTVHEYSLPLSGSPLQLAQKLQELLPKQQPVFTQWFAGWLRHPYTTPTVVTAYVQKFPDESFVEEKLLARRVSANGGLRLVLPKDEGVVNPSQLVRGLKLVSDIQIYLDLIRAGLRGEEQAAELRKWPDFAGGWA